MKMTKSNIQNFYAGQVIFLTGATGSLGKLIIEKLLRACDVKKIFVLVRPKKSKQQTERIKEIWEKECFCIVKAKDADFWNKITLINGDCSQPYLGMDEKSIAMVQKEVTTIIHSAATVRFDQDLKTATHINVRAVKDLIELAKQMPQLEAFVHISTAFSHCTNTEIGEKVYETIPGENLIQLVNCLDTETLTEITPSILKKFPNTYVLTKAVAEEVVESHRKDLPITIVRPAIITNSAKEPLPGWIDNVYGIISIVLGVSMGLIRTMPADPDAIVEVVPLDFVVNAVLAAGWHTSKSRNQNKISNSLPIFNLALSPELKFTYGDLERYGREFQWQYPPLKAVWYYCFNCRPNPYVHEIAIFFLHTLPAYFVDLILFCLGRKPMLVDAYKKIRKHLDVVHYFATRNWKFSNENLRQLIKAMSPQDRELFDFDMRHLDLQKYLETSLLGGRQYLIRESLDNLPQAKMKCKVLMVAHYTLCGFLLFGLFLFCRFVFSCFF